MTTVGKEEAATQASAVAASLAVGTLGPAVLLMLPGLLAALSERYAFSERQLGILSFADLGGLTLGSALSARLLPAMGVVRGTQLGLLGAVVANGASATVAAFAPLLILRVGAGLGGGLLVGSCYMVLGRLKHVDRTFGIYLLCQGVFGAVALKVMPALTQALGIAGIFGALALLYAAALALPRFLPASEGIGQHSSERTGFGSAAWSGLAAVLIFFVAQGAVWAYLELMGQRGGLDASGVATAVALSTLVGLSGPLTAALLGSRIGKVFPLLSALALALISLALLNSTLNVPRFALAACLFNVAWNLSIPYQMAALAGVDASGKVVAWAASASLAGLAVGPPIAGAVLASRGTSGVLLTSATLYVVSVIALLPALTGPAARRSPHST
ncbi:MAG: MFS transporter [Terriglobales bacterium]